MNFEKNKRFLGLITRCKDEYFIRDFCDYYLSQGVDEINIIDDDSDDKSIYEELLDRKDINIFFENNITKDNYFSNWIEKLRDKYEWVIYVDVDEYIVTKKNLNKTIRDELETTFKGAHCIKVPWVMMSCNLLEKNPKSILKEITHRWNHDKRHPNEIHKFRCRYDSIEIKSIFKPQFFSCVSSMPGKDHHPHNHLGDTAQIRDGLENKPGELNPFYKNLRESDINTGLLLCYHYRIISIENCIHKLNTNRFYRSRYLLQDLMKSDHPEVVDKTLKNKSDGR